MQDCKWVTVGIIKELILLRVRKYKKLGEP